MKFRSRLNIDLSIFSSNLNCLKEIAPSNDILFMVKADGYGHGSKSIVSFSYNELNIKEFGTATLEEALVLRRELSKEELELYVFSDLQISEKSNIELYLNQRIIPVISNINDLQIFLNASDFSHFPLVLKFNTGMNRLGFDLEETESVIKLIKKSGRSSIDHLMSHFSSSSLSMNKNKRNIYQKEKFVELKSQLKGSGISINKSSLSNSGAIIQKSGLEESHIRPGLMLFGPSSILPSLREKYPWSGKIISKLETYIIRTYPVEKGCPVGYGATPCPDNGIIAIIALGYGDGFLTRSQGSTITFKGHQGKVVGRVNMDMAQIFFDKSAAQDLRAGELFIVWGHNQEHFLDFAEQSGAIPYELFCQLSSRIPRIYSLN
jgi:alanine racemase